MSKQDRQGARTISEFERRHNYGERFNEVMGVANDARQTAEKAMQSVDGLTQEEVFNILTNNGEAQGLYRSPDGQVYINASYIASGILQAADGSLQIDLNTGALSGKSPDGNLLFSLHRNSSNTGAVMHLMSNDQTKKIELDISDESAFIGFSYNGSTKIMMHYMPTIDESKLQIEGVHTDYLHTKKIGADDGTTISSKNISWKDNGDGTYTLIGT